MAAITSFSIAALMSSMVGAMQQMTVKRAMRLNENL